MIPGDVIIIRRCCHLVVGNWLWALHRHECSVEREGEGEGEREREGEGGREREREGEGESLVERRNFVQHCWCMYVSTAVGRTLLYKTKMKVGNYDPSCFPAVDYYEMRAVHNYFHAIT